MKVQVRGKNIDVTPALRDYVEKRLGKLEKFLDNIGEAQATLVVEGDAQKIEVTIPVNGMLLRGEEATGDMYSAIDLVVEKMERQISRYKGKINRRNGRNPAGDVAGGEKIEDETPKVLRTKRFAIKPMPLDEAIMQMNLLGHDFFVFSNADTEQVNVIYKRKDGNYGLIEPEFE
ncbi:sigma 54 modulation protein/ribosomal protein S30EA [Desulfotomaculum nigrificans CO-1-SRB]|uniref:Ribosome hibernation promoting factor n=1 Tax=Desulfotomaculum nigrificans (strain DSM 14880 / VKM B-2319 / CO-1-SRB) TaxID=868595 RepID=F6B509_DESCC|nr:ribosome-associated translation inhibitor RaiA [Desulfotomaculum nigrificans]AEF95381.1 sigma 54 modulation protein/ribosomal protein S30EA [Desulfotomaculum nigrificans CO-1-SRB]